MAIKYGYVASSMDNSAKGRLDGLLVMTTMMMMML
jgi:hypothetical protein